MHFKMTQLFLATIILNFLFFYIEKITNFVNIFDKPDNKLKNTNQQCRY